jgi:hypothetical protein
LLIAKPQELPGEALEMVFDKICVDAEGGQANKAAGRFGK